MNNLTVVENTQPTRWTQEEKALIKNTVAKDATDAELDWFFQVCTARQLNPYLKQVWFIKRGGTPTIQTSIDGFRAIANRTGKLAGIKRGTKMVDGILYGWAEVYRKDWVHPAYEEVSIKEYGGGGPLWGKMPQTMIKKVAESAALRMAFPEDLSGLYSNDEMAQADDPLPDPYHQNAGPSVNTPEQQDTYKADKKAIGERIKAKREYLGLDKDQLTALLGKVVQPGRMTLDELKEIETFLEDFETRMLNQDLTPSEMALVLDPDEPIEAEFTEAQQA